MNLKACIAILLFVAVTGAAISANIPAFLDTASLLIVLGGAVCFGICANGKWYSEGRLNAFSEGAVLSGWIGVLLGAVLISGNVKDLDALGPAIAIMLLTVVYGYFVKALVRMVLLSRSKE